MSKPQIIQDIEQNSNEINNLSGDLAAHKADYADLKGYIGYTEDDIYGVEADFVNSKFTRLAGAINKTPGADFNSINAFGGRKRCILTDDGVVLAYYGEPGYVETGKLTQAITTGHSYVRSDFIFNDVERGMFQ